jgi:hypothetical protein
MAHQLRVDARLADASRDELAVLAAEVDDQHRALLGCGLWGRERDELILRKIGLCDCRVRSRGNP